MPDEIGDDATLQDTSPHTAATPRSSTPVIDARYQIGDVIGRGGMGEVRLARDVRIDREVAVKLMRSEIVDEVAITRFLREARIQGVLDHPSVVPVHDLGLDRDGKPFFVMKKLAGTTFAELLAARSSSDDSLQVSRRLLSCVVDVALAIAFAHARGVVHRDIKPANVMLGDYGETYVLDWGVAKVIGEASRIPTIEEPAAEGDTAIGALLGTLGYMSPEQACGEEVDTRADVFSLGCLLYEVLTGVPALPRGPAALEATADEHRPSARIDVAPELDELCAQATARDRERRPSARELADRLQAYLDGDRDIMHRKRLAEASVGRALAALARPGDRARADAMREAGRAFVLDPENAAAQDVLAGLVLDAPADPPAEALAAAAAEQATMRAAIFRRVSRTYLGIAAVVGLLFLLPIRVAWPLIGTLALCCVMAGAAWVCSKRAVPARSATLYLLLGINCILLTCGAFIFGPLLIAPMFLVGALAAVASFPSGISPAVLVLGHAIPIALPVGLELGEVTPSSFAVVDGSFVFTPIAVELTPLSGALVYGVILALRYVNSTVIAISVRRSADQALERVHVQSWHLRKLLPDATESRIARAATPSTARESVP